MFTEQDYEKADTMLGTNDVKKLKAVSMVESSGQNFWNIKGEQRPPIRLEAHWFGNLTKYKYNDTHPHISSKKWNPGLASSTWEGAWDQFEEAYALNPDAAIQACSWGPFQVMGFHWQKLGYDSPQAFKAAAYNTAGQMDMFVRFILNTPAAHDALLRGDWEAFENAYNGGGYNGAYATKIRAAYENL